MHWALPFLHVTYTDAVPRGPMAVGLPPGTPRVPVAQLRTERLLLRDWRDDDLPAFQRLNLDREVRRYFPAVLTPYESDAFAKTIREGLARDGWGLWAVEVLGGAPFIGFVGLARPTFEPFTNSVELGYRLARDAWGRGYATEAAIAAAAFAFTSLGLTELLAFTATTNGPSRRVMEKVGMRHDPASDFLHPRVPDGHPLQPHVCYRLDFEAFQRARMTPPVMAAPATPGGSR
ncbi:MAG: GNAT family N-acetyltransferase [Myxococcaceae bacterium]|nr:GNAT family N-acetyltransferase [Myxococcaceae bacterium]